MTVEGLLSITPDEALIGRDFEIEVVKRRLASNETASCYEKTGALFGAFRMRQISYVGCFQSNFGQ